MSDDSIPPQPPRFLMALFTGKDNRSADMGRVLWAWLALILGGLQGYAVIGTHAPFDPVAFATAAGLMMAGGAGALGLKAGTEPEPRRERNE